MHKRDTGINCEPDQSHFPPCKSDSQNVKYKLAVDEPKRDEAKNIVNLTRQLGKIALSIAYLMSYLRKSCSLKFT